MFQSIRGRLIVMLVLVAGSVFSLLPRTITVRERSADGQMRDVAVKRVPLKYGLDLQGGIHLALEVDDSKGPVADPAEALDRALTVIRTRIDEFGVAEPLIQKVGNERIVVELAGIDDPNRAKQIVQRAAFLEWRITDMRNQFADALPAIDRALREAGVTMRGGDEAPAPATPSALEGLLGPDAPSDTAASDTTFTLDQPGPLSEHLFSGGVPGEFLVPEEEFPRVDSLIRLPEATGEIPRGLELVWAPPSRSRRQPDRSGRCTPSSAARCCWGTNCRTPGRRSTRRTTSRWCSSS